MLVFIGYVLNFSGKRSVNFILNFQLSSCLINRYLVKDSAKGTLLAGFISGSAYYICPNYRFFTHGAVTAVQVNI